ncbi:MAG: WS/DGAT/MGAT family O-acyltransferase [Alphaproteobacteria bacterium]
MASQLSSIDGTFLYTDSRNTPETIGNFGIYDPSTARDGFVRFKDILRTFETRLDRVPTFTKKIMRVPMDLDQAYWIEDENFDLEYHVRHIALPKPGDWRQLQILIARLHSHPLDLDRPLWQTYIIEGLDGIEGIPKGCFAHYIKLHHAAVDGMGANQFLFSLHDAEPVFPVGEYGSDLKKRAPAEKPRLPEMAARAYTNFLKQQLGLAKLGAEALPQLAKERKFRKEHGVKKIHKKPETRFEKTLSPNRVYAALEFPFSKVKEIRQAVPGVTVNDLAVTIVSRGLRSYLSSKDELPDQSLISMVPVSLRKQEEATGGGNAVSMLTVPIHTDVADPLEALKRVNETMTKSKIQRQDVGEPIMIKAADHIPSVVQSGIGQLLNIAPSIGRSATPANTTISNVPGPRVPMYLAGAKAIKFHGIGILVQGMGLFNVVSSYLDNMTISFLACRNQMPDPEVYEAAIREAFEEIYTAATNPAAKPKPKSKKT